MKKTSNYEKNQQKKYKVIYNRGYKVLCNVVYITILGILSIKNSLEYPLS